MDEKKLYLFNPDNDLALANGNENYMAPSSARKMSEDLACLPIWYADGDGYVLASSAYNNDYLKLVKSNFPFLQLELLTEPEVQTHSSLSLSPWGWNHAIRKRMLQIGVDESVLCCSELINHIRALSHRSSWVDVLSILNPNELYCGNPHYFTEIEQVVAFLQKEQKTVLKSPLSGSGKGLNWYNGLLTGSLSGWINRTIELQGGIIAEPYYNKELDFAMEFYASECGVISFVGYSLFRTNPAGSYEGNSLLSDQAIEEQLSAFISLEDIYKLRDELIQVFSTRIAGCYNGYLGVDMMICRFESSPTYRIHPCVEVNLRMNMGVVAHSLYQRYICPRSKGLFVVDYDARAGEALCKHQKRLNAFPLKLKDGRIRSGYLALTPVHQRTQYTAWVLVEEE